MNKATELAAHVRAELGKAIVGQRESLDQLLLVMLVGGHALVEGVPGSGENSGGKSPRANFPAEISTRAMHSRPHARRHSWRKCFQSFHQFVRAASRADLHRSSARGRNQPHAAAHAVRASGSHGRKTSDHRRHPLRTLQVLRRFRDAESRGVRRHLPAAGSAARSLPRQNSHRLSRR